MARVLPNSMSCTWLYLVSFLFPPLFFLGNVSLSRVQHCLKLMADIIIQIAREKGLFGDNEFGIYDRWMDNGWMVRAGRQMN
ncbi:hypothetical protein F5X98DRAFT_295314 [Xylaria grammica]|nr:hypothetical protein F5X98DRAFT_295314 [Xylaria grammica]